MRWFKLTKDVIKSMKPYVVCGMFLLSLVSIAAWWDWGQSKKEDTRQESRETRSSQKAAGAVSSPEEQREDVEKIQGELKEVISRTSQLQNQVQGNRSEIQDILERAQIHERILRSMNTLRTTTAVSKIDADEIIRREKIRLIANETQRTQQQLRTIQQAQSVKTASYTPTDTRASRTS